MKLIDPTAKIIFIKNTVFNYLKTLSKDDEYTKEPKIEKKNNTLQNSLKNYVNHHLESTIPIKKLLYKENHLSSYNKKCDTYNYTKVLPYLCVLLQILRSISCNTLILSNAFEILITLPSFLQYSCDVLQLYKRIAALLCLFKRFSNTFVFYIFVNQAFLAILLHFHWVRNTCCNL